MPDNITVTGNKAYFNQDASFFSDVKIYGDLYFGGNKVTNFGGSGESYWFLNNSEIHTLFNVGIGTTNPTSKLTVEGDAIFTGIVTAAAFYGDGSTLSNIIATGSGVQIRDDGSPVGTAATINFGNNISVSLSAGVANVTTVGLAAVTYVDSKVGLSTVGLASITYVDSKVGLSTVGLASITYVDSKVGLSTVGLASITYVDNKVGLATSGLLSSTGSGSNLTGIVASITAGPGISVNQSTGNVTITNTSNGGSFVSSQWGTTNAGIHTLSNVGIGTTNPTSKLTVSGNVIISGVTTASSFIKSGGTSSQFLKADGSVDSSVYLTSYNETDTLNSVTTRGSTTSNSITVGNATASSFIKSGGTSSQFLKADGSVDSNVYLNSTGSGSNLTGIVTYITAGSGISINQSTGNVTITNTSVGGGGISGLTVRDEGNTVGTVGSVTSINFVGENVTATASGTGSTITIATQTYVNTAGVATYSNISGIATYASTAGVATYSNTSGIATYASTAGVSTVSQGLTGTPNIQVGIVTATSYNGSGEKLTGIVTYITAGSGISINQSTGNVTITNTSVGGGGISGLTVKDEGNTVGSAGSVSVLNFVGENVTATASGTGSTITIATQTYVNTAGIATYASTAGVATYASTSGVSTYSNTAGIATYSNTAGIATYSSTAGIATYASTAGIATYASTAGVSTVSQGLTGAPNIQVGIVTATSYNGSGEKLTGIVTYIEAGPGIILDQNIGKVTITSIGAGGGGLVGLTIKDEGSTVGSAGSVTSLNFVGDNVTASASGTGSTITIATQTYVNTAGVATYSNTSGIATYASTAGVSTVSQGLTGTPNIQVGIVTATSYNGSGTNLTGIVTSITAGSGILIDQSTGNVTITNTISGGGISGLTVKDEGNTVGSAGSIASLNFVGENVTATASGSGSTITITPQTYVNTAGIATYASTAGVATYASTSGVATVSQGLTGIPNILVDVLTATSYNGSGSNLTGIVTYINAGSGISVDQNVGKITITAIGGLSGAFTYCCTNNITSTCLTSHQNITSACHNFFAGVGVGCSIVDGFSNNFFGRYSGKFTTSGSRNNFLGDCAGFCNTLGNDNNFLGNNSGRSNTIGNDNNFFGSSAGYANTSGRNNNFSGNLAGRCNTNGCDNNFFGSSAGYLNISGCHNNFFGNSAGYSNCGCYNNFFGYIAGNSNTTGCRNNFFGEQAGRCNNSGSSNNFLGASAGRSNSSGCYNNFFGRTAGYENISGCHNTFIGLCAGFTNTSGCHNTFLGSYSGISNTASRKIVLGSGFNSSNLFDSPSTNKSIQFAVGVRTDANASKYWLVGDENFNIGIGITNPASKLQVDGTVTAVAFVGDGSGLTAITATGTGIEIQDDSVLVGTARTVNFAENISVSFVSGIASITSIQNFNYCCTNNITSCVITTHPNITTACHNFFAGVGVGCSITSGYGNNFFGFCAGKRNTTGNSNNFFGYLAGNSNISGCYNNFLGRSAGRYNTTGCHNNFFGHYAGRCNDYGNYNNFFGRCAGNTNCNGNNNNFLGYLAGCTNSTGSSNNFFGCGSGLSNSTGSNNNFFGSLAGRNSSIGSDNNFFGQSAGRYTSCGSHNNFLGSSAGYCNTSGRYNNFFGRRSGCCNTTGSFNTYLGSFNGISGISSYRVIIGSGGYIGATEYQFDSPNTSKSSQLAIGLRSDSNPSKYWLVGDENFNIGIGTTNPTSKLHVTGNSFFDGPITSKDINSTGIITATAFVGNGSGLTGVVATGAGIEIRDDNSPIGTAGTVNFAENLSATIISGIASISAKPPSRTTITGVSTSLASNGIGTTELSLFKTYGITKITTSVDAWIRLYTDSTSRTNDASRLISVDPSPGSGVVIDVSTYGISPRTIKVTPYVIGFNDDTPVTDKVYVTVQNLSGITTSVSFNITVLNLES